MQLTPKLFLAYQLNLLTLLDLLITMLRPSQNATFLTFGHVAQKLISVGYFVVIARLVGAEGIGVFAFVISLMLVLGVIVDAGLNFYVTREVARDQRVMQNLLARGIALKLIGGVLAYGLLVLFLYFTNISPLARTMGLIVGVSMMLDGFMLLFYAILRGLQDFRYEAIGMALSQLMIAIIGISGLLLGGSLVVLAWAFLSGSVINMIYAAWRLRQKIVIPWPVWSVGSLWALLFATSPFLVSAIFTRIYGYADTLLLTLLTDEATTGYYAAGSKIPFALTFIPGVFAAAVYPRLSKLAHDQPEAFRLFFTRALVVFGVISLPLGVGLALVARDVIILFYGVSFLRSVAPLAISSIGFIFYFFSFLFSVALNASDRQIRAMVHLGIAAAVNIILNIIFIPRWQETGAAWAALVTGLVIVVLGKIALRQEIFKCFGSLFIRFIKIVSATAGMALVIMWLPNVHVFISVVSAAVTYVLLILVLGVFKTEDWQTLRVILKV